MTKITPAHDWRRQGLLLMVLALILALCIAPAHGRPLGKGLAGHDTPVGHEKVITLMANGRYDPRDETFMPPDFEHFSKKVMGWDETQREQFEQEAHAFFRSRFGVDVSDPDYADRVMVVPFMLDPRWEYRVYDSSGDYVPPQGWVVRDGGFQLVAIDPEGIELGGDFAGQHVPQGAVAAFGKYNIQVWPALGSRHSHDEMVIHYQSRKPVLQNSGFPLQRGAGGTLVAPLEVFHEQYGHGWAFAHITDVPQPDGQIQTLNRNIMTFPAGAAFSGEKSHQ